MKNELNPFRTHLLNAELPDPLRRGRLEQEIEAMLDDRLSTGGLAGWAVSLVASALFATTGAALVAAASVDLPLRLILVIYTAANLAWTGYALKVLRVRRFDYRSFGRAIGGIVAVPAIAITAVLFWRAALVPSPASFLWLLLGLTCVAVNGFWVLYGRIIRGEWAAKEDALRLQLLVMETVDNRSAASPS